MAYEYESSGISANNTFSVNNGEIAIKFESDRSFVVMHHRDPTIDGEEFCSQGIMLGMAIVELLSSNNEEFWNLIRKTNEKMYIKAEKCNETCNKNATH